MTTKYRLAMCLLPGFALAGWSGSAPGQCVADPVSGAIQFDIDYLFWGLDNNLGEDYPQWLQRYRQENTADPTPAFANEDNSQNGIDDDDHVELLGAVLSGEPASLVLGGIPEGRVTEIRAAFTANRGKVRPDLTLVILFVTVNIIDEINKSDPAFGESLQDLVAAYMTLGDAASVQYIRGLLITLGEIFIEVGVSSGEIPGFIAGTVKSVLRNTVNANFVASRYSSYGDAPGATKPNWLGASGNISGAGASNLAAYDAAGRNRQNWLLAKGVVKPPLEIVTPPVGLSVTAGEAAVFDAVIAGGDGGPVGYDWKRVNEATGASNGVGTSPLLAFPYAVPSDSGLYSLYVCDDTWMRAAQPARLAVAAAGFQFLGYPEGADKVEGESHTFSVRVIGGEVLPAYRWYRGATAAAMTEIPGATDSDLSIGPLQLSDAGFYQARVTGGPSASPVTLESSVVVLTVSTAPDVVSPVITVNGDNPLFVECGGVYVEPGASAWDAVDGDVSATVVISGTVSPAIPGEYALTYTARDRAGNSATVVRTVVVRDMSPPNLLLIGPDPLVVSCGAAFVDPGAQAMDACDGDISGAIVIEGLVNSALPGPYLRIYRVEDEAGNATQITRTVLVADTEAPVLNLLGANLLFVPCGGTFTDPGATALDACAGDLSGAIEVTGSVNTAVPGDYPVVYAVQDAAGNRVQAARTVRVVDTEAPEITLLGDTTLNIACGGIFSDPGATAWDACTGDLSAAIEVTGGINTAVPGNYPISYAVQDAEGNRVQTTRIVWVVDNEAPVVTLLGDGAIDIACGDAFSDPGVTAWDICNGDLSAAVEVTGTVDTAASGDYLITYSVRDAARNTAHVTRMVRVVDTEAPEITLLGDTTLVLSCNTVYEEAGATAYDACDGDLSAWIELSGAPQSGAPGVHEVTYSVADAAGNVAFAVRIVTILDECDIVITRQPRSLALYTGMRAEFEVAARGGSGPLAFQWRKDGVSIEDARDVRLVIDPVFLEDTGDYDCMLSDGIASERSARASLHVYERPESGQQSADINGDWNISLTELLRVIQFFNVGELSCGDGTEDGYTPGSGGRVCEPHDTDYNPRDWVINLSELLRLIQFYNTPGGLYHRTSDTEDGLAPGAG